MNKDQKQYITKNITRLINATPKALQPLTTCLLGKGQLTEDEKEIIEARVGHTDRAFELYSSQMKKGPHAFQGLIEALTEVQALEAAGILKKLGEPETVNPVPVPLDPKQGDHVKHNLGEPERVNPVVVPLDPKLRDHVRHNLRALKDNTNCNDDLLDEMVANKIFTTIDKEEVLCKSTPDSRKSEFYTKIMTKGQAGYLKTIDVLKTCEQHISADILQTGL